jgi:hypothetical protein
LYCLDLALPEQLPELDDRFRRGFAVPSLPGDESCLLRYVPTPCRTMMGPNVYIVPPGAFTWFHIDGGGPVDSGHQALTGLNEVYMLRRLGPSDNQAAVDLLRGSVQYALGDLAHDEGVKPPWPDGEAIRRAWDANMAPSHVLLYPGDYLHIGKGRLHAFRKLDERSPVSAFFFSRPADQSWLAAIRAITGFNPLPQRTAAAFGPAPGASIATLEESAAGAAAGVGASGAASAVGYTGHRVRVPSPWAACAPTGDILGACVSVAWDWAYMGSTVKVWSIEATRPLRAFVHVPYTSCCAGHAQRVQHRASICCA